jgi:hypothetical protein
MISVKIIKNLHEIKFPFIRIPLLCVNSDNITYQECQNISKSYESALNIVLENASKRSIPLRRNAKKIFYVLSCSHKKKVKLLVDIVDRFMQLKRNNHDIELRWFTNGRDTGVYQIHWKFKNIKENLRAVFTEKILTTWKIIKYSDEHSYSLKGPKI